MFNPKLPLSVKFILIALTDSIPVYLLIKFVKDLVYIPCIVFPVNNSPPSPIISFKTYSASISESLKSTP
jgi:hypothetical protein